MTSGAINVSSQLKKELRAMHRNDVGRSRNIFEFSVERPRLGGIDLRQQRFINQPKPAV